MLWFEPARTNAGLDIWRHFANCFFMSRFHGACERKAGSSGDELLQLLRLVKHRRPYDAIQHGAVEGEIKCPSKGRELQCAPRNLHCTARNRQDGVRPCYC